MPDYEKELKTALNAVEKACELCMEAQRTLISEESTAKNDRSPVTIADFGSQALVNTLLSAAFPEDKIIGEEESAILRQNKILSDKVFALLQNRLSLQNASQVYDAIDLGAGITDPSVFTGRYWTLDPIDGTRGFLRKDQYAVALALVEKGEAVLAVLGCPDFPLTETEKGGIFYALRGQGAFVRPMQGRGEQRLRVDRDTKAENARFCESVESAHADHDVHGQICKMAGFKAPPFRMDSQAKYAAVAAGKASVYLRLPRKKDYREKIWDHAAGALIVEEAGGKVSDFSGNPLDFSRGRTLESNTGILVSNGLLHDAVLHAVQEIRVTGQIP